MVRGSFPEIVRKYFGFLEYIYGFSVVKEKMYEDQPFGDGIVEFRSSRSTIYVRLDRGDVLIDILPSSEPEIAKLSLDVIVDFLTNGKETNLVQFLESSNRIEPRVEDQLKLYSDFFLKYVAPLLQGDFSWWINACKYFQEKMRTTYRSWTGEELPENEPFDAYIKSKEDSFDQG